MRVDDWSLDICVAGPQKCLASAPGLSLVAVSDRAWQAIHANPAAPRHSYLSLLDWQATWETEGRFPYTPSVTDVTGLEAACDEVLEEGLDAVIARHESAARARAGRVARRRRRAVGRLGGVRRRLRHRDPRARRASTRRSCARSCAPLRRRDLGRPGPLVGKVVRIGHMGIASTSLYPVVGVTAVTQALADLGVAVDVGAAGAATLRRSANGHRREPREPAAGDELCFASAREQRSLLLAGELSARELLEAHLAGSTPSIPPSTPIVTLAREQRVELADRADRARARRASRSGRCTACRSSTRT